MKRISNVWKRGRKVPDGDVVGALAVAVPPLSWKLRHVIPQLQWSGV